MAYPTIDHPHRNDEVLNMCVETNYGVNPDASWDTMHVEAGGFEMHTTPVLVRSVSSKTATKAATASRLGGIDVNGSLNTPLIVADLTALLGMVTRTTGETPSYSIEHQISSLAGVPKAMTYTGVKVEELRISGDDGGAVMLDYTLRARKEADSGAGLPTAGAYPAGTPYMNWAHAWFFGAGATWLHETTRWEVTIRQNLQPGPYCSADKAIYSLHAGLEEVTISVTGVFSQDDLRQLVYTDTLTKMHLKLEAAMTLTEGTPTFTNPLDLEVYTCRVTEHPLSQSEDGYCVGTVTLEGLADPTNSDAVYAFTAPS